MPANAGDERDVGSITRSGAKGNPLQYSYLENSVDIPRVRKELDTTEQLNWTELSARHPGVQNQVGLRKDYYEQN